MDNDKELTLKISNKVKELMKMAGLNRFQVAKRTGIDSANFYKALEGKESSRGYSFASLRKLAKFFNITVSELVGESLEVPIVARASALTPFPNPHLSKEKFGTIIHQGAVEMAQLESLYAVEVEDRSMMPFRPGTKFVLEKGSSAAIHDEDIVVCLDDKGTASIGRISFTSDQLITLRSLNPAIPDQVLPRTHLSLCDKVVGIFPPN